MQSVLRNVCLALGELQFFICVVLFDYHGNPSKHCYVHFVHGDKETHLGYKQIRVSDLFNITQLESARDISGVLNF